MLKILNVVGARPNFVKIAPIYRAYSNYEEIVPVLIHTGQHHDYQMSKVFFKSLDISAPDYNLDWDNNTTINIEKIFLKEKPDIVLVVGDVDSSLMAASVASRMGIKIAHIESGLRSFDKTMPEENNRITIDHLSDKLFVSEWSGVENLKNEGIDNKKIVFVGNVMFDNLINSLSKIEESNILKEMGLESGKFILQTVHRQSNVDNKKNLKKLLEINRFIANQSVLVFCLHPRTKKNLKKFNLWNEFNSIPKLKMVSPLPYFDMLSLVKNSFCVMTDSGGVQEEAAFLKVPTLTLRENTERPSTIEVGANKLVGLDEKKIVEELSKLKEFDRGLIHDLELADGKASQRIVSELLSNTI